MLIPSPLKPGDKIAILTPATIVKPEYIDGAARLLADEGFVPVVMPHAKGPADGSYAATDADRLADLIAAYTDPSIRAIFCARGGYGCNHLLDDIDPALIAADPKWLIGFSDVSALHALSQYAGVVSLHAPMAKHLTQLGAGHYCTQALLRILRDGLPVEYIIPSHPLNRPGTAEGRLVGGNLAVINGLASTPFDPLIPPADCARRFPGGNRCENMPPLSGSPPCPALQARVPADCARRFSGGNILFIEDIGEKIYAVERMLIRLRLAGVLDSLAGLIVGQFTDYHPDRNHPDMETMISRLLRGGSFPVCFGFPAGHVDDNLPLPFGANAILTVNPEETTLSFPA